MSSAQATKMKSLFQKYDTNGDGIISREELEFVLQNVGTFPEKEINTIFVHIDKNKDGQIQYEEFVNWVMTAGNKDHMEEEARIALASSASSRDVFFAFAGIGKADMDGKSFTKMCKDCGLVDKKFTVTDADLVFAKAAPKGQRRMGLHDFERALGLVAEKKGVPPSAILKRISSSGGPILHGTKADYVSFHDDKNTYTGVHVHGGPDAVAKGLGHAPVGSVYAAHPSTHTGAKHTPHPPLSPQGGAVRSSSSTRPAPKPKASPTPSPPSSAKPEGRSPASLAVVFARFTGGKGDMDGKTFSKLCKDCHLFDKKYTPTDADILFSKVSGKGQRRIGSSQFQEALSEVAHKKGVSLEQVESMVMESGGPGYQGTKTEYVAFHDDKSMYTGTHVHGGPEAGAMGSGTSCQMASAGMRVVN